MECLAIGMVEQRWWIKIISKQALEIDELDDKANIDET